MVLLAFVLRDLLFSRLFPVFMQVVAFIVVLLSYTSAQLWVKKFPDVKKREDQAFTCVRIYSIFLIVLMVLLLIIFSSKLKVGVNGIG